MKKSDIYKKSGYKRSARNHVVWAKEGVMSEVDFRNPRLYHEIHLEVERGYLPQLTIKEKRIMRQHMEAHELALKFKRWKNDKKTS